MFVAQAIANFMRQRRSLSVAPADVPTPSTSTMSHEPTAPTPSAAITPTVPSTSFFGNVDDKLNTLSTTEINATSIRKLSFDGIDGILHEEPDVGEPPNTISPPSGYIPFVPKKNVKFVDKTAGARTTRSQKPELESKSMLRGIATSTGFAAFALGATLSAAVYAMGTVNLLEEITSDRGFS